MQRLSEDLLHLPACLNIDETLDRLTAIVAAVVDAEQVSNAATEIISEASTTSLKRHKKGELRDASSLMPVRMKYELETFSSPAF